MANDTFDYARLLNDIDTKMASLQSLRASVLVASASGALGQPIEGADLPTQTLTAPGRSNTNVGVPVDLPEGAFNGKSVPACIELYLSSAPMKKRTNKEIASALQEGGVESNASKFDTIVAGALFKLKKDGKILRFKDGWGLSEWYPPHIRGTSDGTSVKRSKKKAKKKARNAHPEKVTGEQQAAPLTAQTIPPWEIPSQKKAHERALDLLETNPTQLFSLENVGQHLGMGVKGARLILGKLTKAGKVEKTIGGAFRAAS